MNLSQTRRVYDTVNYLIACTLNRHTPKKELLDEQQIKTVYSFAKKHSVSALVTAALERIGLADQNAVIDKNMAIRKIMLLDAEREALFSEFEKRGIRYLPLKGIIIKELYPSIGLRQMSDNDILFDPAHRSDIKEIMSERGYSVKEYNNGNHDVYVKEPVYNFEMHVSLFNEYWYGEFYNYFDDAFAKAVKDQDKAFGYSMTDEDYYIYVKAHEYKHFCYSGTGVRSLVDTYVYLKNKKNQINQDYIKAELEKLGLSEYEEKTRHLAFKIYDVELCERLLSEYMMASDNAKDIFTDEERAFLDKFILSGTYGTLEQGMQHTLEKMENDSRGGKGVRSRYLMSRLFPPMDYYKSFYPFFYKYKILIPFLVIYRIGVMIFVKPKSSFKKLGELIRYKKK